ncbi:MAG: methyltransferase domain-containing protein [Chloroflexi bacterium]|nr:methyltransferase domain-containing protein [Chloroflexota bacterium]
MEDAATLRNALIDGLKQNQCITDARVEAAFRAVPRHLFVADVPLEQAYADDAIITKTIEDVPVSSISQPAMVAVMLEQLALREGDRVLEIGAGTGYNAALMAQLVGASGHVTTMDIDEDIVAQTKKNLEGAGIANVQVICADGGFGYAPNAPYDAIIATVGIWDIPPTWLEQLRQGMRLVAPLMLNSFQRSIAFRRVDNQLISASIQRCGFLRLRGQFQSSEQFIDLGDAGISVDDTARVDAIAVKALLAQTPRQIQIAEQGEELRNFLYYLGLRGELVFILYADKEKFGFSFARGLSAGTSSMVLVTQADYTTPLSNQISVYGDDSASDRFQVLLEEWTTRGRPQLDLAQITAAPLGTFLNDSNKLVLRKRWMEYEIDFQNTRNQVNR